jgi:hypothetical protein
MARSTGRITPSHVGNQAMNGLTADIAEMTFMIQRRHRWLDRHARQRPIKFSKTKLARAHK